MIKGFRKFTVTCNGVALSVHRGGQGKPLLLLHGFPQNHMCWERVAPQLAKSRDVIIPDLRGYGESEAPPNESGNITYSKRTMAQDIADLLNALAIQRADVLGHDRGARVAYRFALDHPGRINKLGIIEIVPTADFWASWTADLAIAAYHWTFLAQPAPLPERMIGADPVAYLDWTLAQWTLGKSLKTFSPAALASYRNQVQNPARVHAMCSDYRAGASFDRELDEKDKIAGKQIMAPLRLLCGAHGFPAKSGNAVEVWRGWAQRVEASICDAGHFVMEENPQAVLAAFESFFVS
ncbi:MAG: alpha/beta hydrolase [Burkholderiaceae bacterium]